MAYNKARAEKQWLKWKEAEERKLRELGVDEDTIQRLHTYDWAQFNKERQYLQRQVEWSHYVDWVSAQDLELPVEDTEACWTASRIWSFFLCYTIWTSSPSKSSS